MYKTNFDPSTLSSFTKLCSMMYVGGTESFIDPSYPKTNSGHTKQTIPIPPLGTEPQPYSLC
jgi:hypothetical protein